MSIQPVEFLRRLRIVLRILPSHWQMHRVPSADIASNHALMSNILPNFPLQFRLDLELPQWVHIPNLLLLHLLVKPSL